MSEPWFDASLGWVFGTALGVAGGILGGLGGAMVSTGRGGALVMLGFRVAVVASAVMLVAGVGAFLVGQPYGVWYALGLPGLLGLVVFGSLTPIMARRYREEEARRMAARDAASSIGNG